LIVAAIYIVSKPDDEVRRYSLPNHGLKFSRTLNIFTYVQSAG